MMYLLKYPSTPNSFWEILEDDSKQMDVLCMKLGGGYIVFFIFNFHFVVVYLICFYMWLHVLICRKVAIYSDGDNIIIIIIGFLI